MMRVPKMVHSTSRNDKLRAVGMQQLRSVKSLVSVAPLKNVNVLQYGARDGVSLCMHQLARIVHERTSSRPDLSPTRVRQAVYEEGVSFNFQSPIERAVRLNSVKDDDTTASRWELYLCGRRSVAKHQLQGLRARHARQLILPEMVTLCDYLNIIAREWASKRQPKHDLNDRMLVRCRTETQCVLPAFREMYNQVAPMSSHNLHLKHA